MGTSAPIPMICFWAASLEADWIDSPLIKKIISDAHAKKKTVEVVLVLEMRSSSVTGFKPGLQIASESASCSDIFSVVEVALSM